MRFPALALMLSFLIGCTVTPNDFAVRDGSSAARKELAKALIGVDVSLMRDKGEALLTILSCGWREPSCPQ
jgi:hypothetical protein